MEKWYFTFGSSDKFPYQNTYLIVVASSRDDAIKAFRGKYRDINAGCLNCSCYYSEEQWQAWCEKLYEGMEPMDVIWTENCFGKKPDGYDDLFVFVPEMKQIIRIAEGGGDNLLSEDQNQEYVDYIYYEQYELSNGIPEVDGGMVLLKEMLRDKHERIADCIPDVLDMAYGSYLVNCMILA